MNFMQFLRSLDELLYEVMSWLIFFPVTLWRTIAHPLKMMAYADAELGRTDEKQFNDTLSPPLFLVVALLLSHALGMAFGADTGDTIISDTRGLAGLVSDQTSLLILRLVIFSFFPLIMGTQFLRLKKIPLTRQTLQAPFYAQCLVTAPFALFLGVGSILMQQEPRGILLMGALVVIATVLAFLAIETRWFQIHGGKSLLRSAGSATLALLLSMTLAITVAIFFSGISE